MINYKSNYLFRLHRPLNLNKDYIYSYRASFNLDHRIAWKKANTTQHEEEQAYHTYNYYGFCKEFNSPLMPLKVK